MCERHAQYDRCGKPRTESEKENGVCVCACEYNSRKLEERYQMEDKFAQFEATQTELRFYNPACMLNPNLMRMDIHKLSVRRMYAAACQESHILSCSGRTEL